MNRAFGKLCKCGHYESEHIAERPDIVPKISHDLGILLPQSPLDTVTLRKSCKICDCKMYEV